MPRYSREPDYAAFPYFRFATISEVDVAAGDVLFIPVGWWHAIVSTAPSFLASLTAFHRPNDFLPDFAFPE